MSTFQIILVALFVIFGIAGALAFAGLIPTPEGSEEITGDVAIWGTLPQRTMDDLIIETFPRSSDLSITYREIHESVFDRELVEALASSRGPDIILLPQDLIFRHSDKINSFPFSSMSERRFRDTFIREGELYLTTNGILALPLVVDPMVMYWNRDLFASAGIANAPRTWSDFFVLASQLTLEDRNADILQSAVALGEYRNVSHAKEILSALIMQAGAPITDRNASEGVIGVDLRGPSKDINATASALRYYTEFANPNKSVYTWNRSLPDSQDMLVAGDLAVYFGFASELEGIKRRNPHLDIDAGRMPQTDTGRGDVTFGRMQGLSVLNSSNNSEAAFRVAITLAGESPIRLLAQRIGLPPARRALLADKPTDAYQSVFYASALISNAWLDPDPEETDKIFREMVENVTSSRTTVGNAVNVATKQLDRLFQFGHETRTITPQ